MGELNSQVLKCARKNELEASGSFFKNLVLKKDLTFSYPLN